MDKTNISVLIIEDNPLNAAQLVNFVNDFTNDIAVSTTAERGFHIFSQACQSEKPFRILITDINLPGKSGKELIRDIRALEEVLKPKFHIRVIAISADQPSKHMLEACRVGAGCYLEKPITKEKLLNAVKRTGLVNI